MPGEKAKTTICVVANAGNKGEKDEKDYSFGCIGCLDRAVCGRGVGSSPSQGKYVGWSRMGPPHGGEGNPSAPWAVSALGSADFGGISSASPAGNVDRASASAAPPAPATFVVKRALSRPILVATNVAAGLAFFLCQK